MSVSSINGIGRTYYGKRDFDADGTYTTTKWLIILFLPILPSESIRVNTDDRIVDTLPICWPQVFATYAHFYAFAPFLMFLGTKFHWKDPATIFAFLTWAATPFVLRLFAKYR